jgi:XTP/dITP diphosphohydrolase
VVVLASANPGKQREFAALLAAHGIELVLQSALGIASIAETGRPLRPMRCSRRATPPRQRLPALADDSGLEVDALAGARVCIRRATPGMAASDQDNNAKLLASCAAWPSRRARRAIAACWRSCAAPRTRAAARQRLWEGSIATAPAGEGGFGYDPLFIPQGHAAAAPRSCPPSSRIV